MKDYLQKPESYYYWLKSTARMCFPMKHDFYEVGYALKVVGKCLMTIVTRLLILLLSPIAVPILSVLFWKENHRVMNARAKKLTEEWDGFAPQYTQEEVNLVLTGKKTLSELEREKELSWLK